MQYLAVYNDLLFEADEELNSPEVKLQGMKIFNKEEFDNYLTKVVNHTTRIDWYYNLDDVMEYSDGRELLDKIIINTIKSPEEYVFLFGLCTNTNNSFGYFPLLEQVIME